MRNLVKAHHELHEVSWSPKLEIGSMSVYFLNPQSSVSAAGGYSPENFLKLVYWWGHVIILFPSWEYWGFDVERESGRSKINKLKLNYSQGSITMP